MKRIGCGTWGILYCAAIKAAGARRVQAGRAVSLDRGRECLKVLVHLFLVRACLPASLCLRRLHPGNRRLHRPHLTKHRLHQNRPPRCAHVSAVLVVHSADSAAVSGAARSAFAAVIIEVPVAVVEEASGRTVCGGAVYGSATRVSVGSLPALRVVVGMVRRVGTSGCRLGPIFLAPA